MRKQIKKRHEMVFPIETSKQDNEKLNQIINTFRENHLKLIQKIEECDKKLQLEHQMSRKKMSEKYLNEKHDYQGTKVGDKSILKRPYSQMKTERNFQKMTTEVSRKENLAFESVKIYPNRSDDCEEIWTHPPEDHNVKFVKVKLNKLVPLSMDRLRERLKLL